MTYAEEQSAVKRNLLKQMNQPSDGSDGDGDEGEDFLIKKPGQTLVPAESRAKPDLDVESADRDPETYLSNFMAARAWVPTDASRFDAFESEDEAEIRRADAFEHAWNLRFEDSSKANEKLISHSREAAAKYSVRREEPKGRKRARELEKEQKDAEKRERNDDKARLRRLKIEEAQEKLHKFKQAAGLRGQAVPVEDWAKFIEDGWDSEKWDREMASRFGESYYAGDDDDMDDEEGVDGELKGKKKKKAKRPKWDDDIDIGDIIPDFDEEEESKKQNFTLSDDEDEVDSQGGVALEEDREEEQDESDNTPKKKKVSKKDAEKLRMEGKRQKRKERQKIEELVDKTLLTELPKASSAKQAGVFRYRDTSPTAFGLSARDILMADDAQLNEYAGLKKLASFRDQERKKKDKKNLGKKARLRQWRKDTFGDEDGPKAAFDEFLDARRDKDAVPGAASGGAADGDVNIVDGKKKKKRSRKRKTAEVSG